jgi:hypothetical protein
MRATVNRRLFEIDSFDSASLGPLASVVHQFAAPGRYRAVVSRHGRAVGEIGFTVDEKSESMQLAVDLARTKPDVIDRLRSIVSAKGYVLFHASSGDGYSVVVSSEKEAVFDSARLGAGDLFALTLLEPGTYTLSDKTQGGAAQIEVVLDDAAAKRLRELETRYVDVLGGGFQPKSIELIASQGLVFRLRAEARIVIEKKTREKPQRPTPVIHRKA